MYSKSFILGSAVTNVDLIKSSMCVEESIVYVVFFSKPISKYVSRWSLSLLLHTVTLLI